MVKKTAVALMLFVCSLFGCTKATDDPGESKPMFDTAFTMETFYKGNLHNHMRGDHDQYGEPPLAEDVEAIASWYKKNSYNFLAMTDHVYASDPGSYSYIENQNFVFVHGEEVEVDIPNVDQHLLSLCGNGAKIGRSGKNINETAERIRDIGATPILAHAQYSGISADDIAGVSLMEIWSTTAGPSSEKLWAELLDRGDTIYGIAVDDNHGTDAFKLPRLGWVDVSVSDLLPENICSALLAGRFYASNGVELATISVLFDKIKISVAAREGDESDDYMTEFFGAKNKVLKKVAGFFPSYTLTATDIGYVRAKIHGPAGTAWIQPIMVRKK